MKIIQALTINLGIILSIFLAGSNLVVAQTSTTKSPKTGLTVAPAYMELSIPKSGEEKFYELTVTNNYPKEVNIDATVRAVEEQDGKFLPSLLDTPLLSRVVVLNNTNFKFDSNQSLPIKFSVKDNSQLTPGGHYVSLLISQKKSTNNSIQLESSISVLLYLVKESGAIRQLNIISGPSNGIRLFGLPITLTHEFKNDGNVAVTVRGSVILSSSNQVFKRGIINESAIPLQPGRIQKLQTILSSERNVWLPKKIIVETKYKSSGQDNSQSRQVTIYYLPWYILIVIFVPVIILWRFGFKKLRQMPSKKAKKIGPKSKKPKIIHDIVVNKD